MVRAYLLIDVDSTAGPDLLPRLRGVSLANCKLLAEQLYPGEIIAHLHCTDPPDVTRALVENISALKGVKRTTLLTLINVG